MKTINVVNGPQNASRIILGCMRMPALTVEEAAGMIRTAAEEGINFFDHATCYGNGEAETRFSPVCGRTYTSRANAACILTGRSSAGRRRTSSPARRRSWAG